MAGTRGVAGRLVKVARYLALGGAVLLALLPFMAHGALPATRLDWGGKAPMATRRTSFGLAAAPNGKLYAVGGFNGTESIGTLEEYDPAINGWVSKQGMPTVRNSFGFAAAPNGRLYAVGGLSFTGARLPLTQEYNPETDTWTTRAAMPTPRSGLGLVAAANGKLYAVGGNDGSRIAIVEEYDPATDTWTPKASMPTARDSLGLVAAPNGKLYAIGGNGNGVPSSVAAVEEYDPTTNTWTSRQPLPGLRSDLGVALAPNGRIYAVGGSSTVANCPPDGLCSTVYEYEPATDGWRTKAALPNPARFGLKLAPAPNGKLYAVGGIAVSGGLVYLAIVDEYDPATNTWAAPPTLSSLPAPARFGVASAVANGRLYLFGGADAGATPLRQVSEYTPATNTWRDLTLPATLPVARYGAAAAPGPNGKIYVVGGYNGGYLTTVEEFTPPPAGGPDGSWRAAGDGVQQLLISRSGFGLALAANGKLYAAGGINGSGRLASVEEYDPGLNTAWRGVQPMPGGPRDGLGLALAGDGLLYAVGGDDGSGGASTSAITRVEAFTPPAGPPDLGSWTGRASLPLPRWSLGLLGAPNGKLYAVGGRNTSSVTPTVFEYDATTNGWTTSAARAPMATARYAFGLGLIGDQLVVAGGHDGSNPRTSVERALMTELPTISVGGPYAVIAGQAVQLSATGSDPEGGALSFAWDLDGDLLYETQGQTVNFSAAGLAPGARTVRVRAMDPHGAYRLAVTTVTVADPPPISTPPTPTPPTPTPPTPVTGPCSPRPNVRVETVMLGPGQLQATLRPGRGALSGALRLGQPGRPLENASVSVQGGPADITAAQDVPVSGDQVVLTVTRVGSGPVTVPLAVTDECGEWRSFVGFGPGV